MTDQPQSRYVHQPEQFEGWAQECDAMARAEEALALHARELAFQLQSSTANADVAMRAVYQQAQAHHESQLAQHRSNAAWRRQQAAEARAEQGATR